MAVYVDNMEAQFGRMTMCHMIADSQEELLSMVDRIEVQRKWIQYPNTSREHFDIAKTKRTLAIQYGAIQVDMRTLSMMEKRRQITGSLGLPEDARQWFDAWWEERKAQRGQEGL